MTAAQAPDREIARLGPWFHNLHLPDGRQTAREHPLGDFPAFKWAQVAPCLPADLSGWTALDVGCNAGFYSFELARRGAMVTAVDLDPHYLRQARWAAREFDLEGRIRFQQRQVYALADDDERYDLVLFMGVFYHLRYPLLGLDLVARKVRRLLVFQSLTTADEQPAPEAADHGGVEGTGLEDRGLKDTGFKDMGLDDRGRLDQPGWPRLAFIEESLCGDPTNWWVPNHAGVLAMLRSAGLRVIGCPGHEIHICTPAQRGRPTGEPADPGVAAAAAAALHDQQDLPREPSR